MAGKSQRERLPGIGAFLAGAIQERGWTQEQFGQAAHQSRVTINRVMNTEEVTPGVAVQIADALGLTLDELRQRAAQTVRGGAQRGAPMVGKNTNHTYAASGGPSWSAEARAFILAFQSEAAGDGASDEELDFIRRALTDPGAYVLYEGGRPRVLTDDEVMIELRALAEGLRVWLRERKKRRREGA